MPRSPLALCSHHARLPNGASAISDGSGPAVRPASPPPPPPLSHISLSPSPAQTAPQPAGPGRCSSPGSAASQTETGPWTETLPASPAAGRWWHRAAGRRCRPGAGAAPGRPSGCRARRGAWRAQDCARAVGVAVETEAGSARGPASSLLPASPSLAAQVLGGWGVCLNSAAQLGCTKCPECKQVCHPPPGLFFFSMESSRSEAGTPQRDLTVLPRPSCLTFCLQVGWVFGDQIGCSQLLTHDVFRAPGSGAGKKSEQVCIELALSCLGYEVGLEGWTRLLGEPEDEGPG